MKTTRNFEMCSNRYKYDFGLLTAGNGWAQVDTEQDASYFGTWANPFDLKVFSFTEGDTCLREAENKAEFKAEMLKIKQWNEENGWRFIGIDPGFSKKLRQKFHNIGLESLLH